MTLEVAVWQRLLGLAGVTALVGTRIYLLKIPQQPTYPAIRIQVIDESTEYHMRGPDRGLVTRLQIDAFSSEGSATHPYGSAAAVADAVTGDGLGTGASGLSGFTGDIGGSPGAVHIALAARIARRTVYDPDELRVVRVMQDFEFFWWAL